VIWRSSRVDEHSKRLAWQAASVLLGYPDDQTEAELGAVRAAITALPAAVASPLESFLRWAAETPELERAAHFVATFDQRRACSPYLTYYAHGDTRKRGMALLTFKQAYRRAGLELSSEELPDHLAVVLEFAATVDSKQGERLLLQNRAGIEVLRLALADAGSPYADLLRAVCATLPPLLGPDTDAVQRLVAQGPPVEDVGLEPYGQPPATWPAQTTAVSPDPTGARI
jgi:nitrate reductase delta subunit